jgi:hypothetical protein
MTTADDRPAPRPVTRNPGGGGLCGYLGRGTTHAPSIVRRTTPILLALGVLFVVAFVITYWPAFLTAGVAYGVFLAARAAVRRHRRRQWAHAAIDARADYKHWLLMRGDEWRGTFGRYQPTPWWRA